MSSRPIRAGRLTGLPGAMSGGLVRDLPDAVDPEQIVEVDKGFGLVRSNVPAELDRGCISHLGHGHNSTDDPKLGGAAHRAKLSEIRFL